MGLLDALFPAPAEGGLLDYIKRNAALQSSPSGLQSDQAQYGGQAAPPQASAAGPSPLDNAAWPYGPVGAPSQANAQMIPQQPPAVIPAQPVAPAQPGGLLLPANPISSALGHGADALASLAHGGSLLGAVRGQFDDPQTKAALAANQTAQALVAKGIDPKVAIAAVQPGNTEMLKTLITQSFGPHNIENLGQGYIRDPRTGAVTRAYTPDEKTPAGFVQDDDGKMHFIPGGPADPNYISSKEAATSKVPIGFEKTPQGLRPIKGGPADPDYLRSKAAGENDPNAVKVLGKGGELYKIGPDGQPIIVHKNESETPEATLDDPTVKAMAAQYLAGDRTIMQNLGRGAQGAANIVKLRTEIYKQAAAAHLDGEGIVDNFNEQAGKLAGQRTVGTRAANISLAANEANNMIPVALEASEKVPRGSWMPWNKAVQAYQKGTSSPELASFVAATNSLVNAYVRAVSPGGVPTDSMREHAYSMLNSAQGPEAFKAVVSTMQKEMKAALGAPAQVQKELRHKSGEAETSPVKIDGYTITAH